MIKQKFRVQHSQTISPVDDFLQTRDEPNALNRFVVCACVRVRLCNCSDLFRANEQRYGRRGGGPSEVAT